MRDALIFAGLTIGGVAAVFSSGGSVPAKPRPAVAVASASPSASQVPAAAAPSSSGSTELRRAGDGHFYAGVSVGGNPVTMLVDTGASVIALTGADARAAGLDWNPIQLGVVANGASRSDAVIEAAMTRYDGPPHRRVTFTLALSGRVPTMR